jgi:septal ring factor EnvC (AmiA/AmiB activator)
MRWMIACLAVLMVASTVVAQDVKPDDMKKLLDDTKAQLKAAQDRKAVLAAENDKLAAHVAELEKQLQTQNTQLEDLQRQVADFAERTFFLRSHYQAWQRFIAATPAIKAQWDFFMQSTVAIGANQPAIFMDPQWPLSMMQ